MTDATIGIVADGATDVHDTLIEENDNDSIVYIEVIDLTEIDNGIDLLKVIFELSHYN